MLGVVCVRAFDEAHVIRIITGFDSKNAKRWHAGKEGQGWGKAGARGDVLGVAADLVAGKLLFSLNGEQVRTAAHSRRAAHVCLAELEVFAARRWGAPMGVAFEGVEAGAGLYPALSAQSLELSVNFGSRPWAFAPPDPSFAGVREAVANGGRGVAQPKNVGSSCSDGLDHTAVQESS